VYEYIRGIGIVVVHNWEEAVVLILSRVCFPVESLISQLRHLALKLVRSSRCDILIYPSLQNCAICLSKVEPRHLYIIMQLP
jgi:hypothetical protein